MPQDPQLSEDAEELAAGDFYVQLVADAESAAYLSTSYFEPDEYIHETCGKIVLTGLSGRTLAEIGEFSVIQVDGEGAYAQGVDVYQVFDTRQETFSAFEDLFTSDAEYDPDVLEVLGLDGLPVPLGVLILNRMEIKPAFRGKEYGLHALRTMMQRFRMGVGLYALKPYPLQFESKGRDRAVRQARGLLFKGTQKACTKKLANYYGRLGFVQIPGREFMVLHALEPLADFDARY